MRVSHYPRVPEFDRKHLILRLLYFTCRPEGYLTNSDLQGLLFLYLRKRANPLPPYEFIPHQIGPYSYACANDKLWLVKSGLIKDDSRFWQLSASGRRMIQAFAGKNQAKLAGIRRFSEQHERIRGNRLLVEIYCKHPYYATRSTILEQVLPNLKYRQRVLNARPRPPAAPLTCLQWHGSVENLMRQLYDQSSSLLVHLKPAPADPAMASDAILKTACNELKVVYWSHPDLQYVPGDLSRWNTPAEWMNAYQKSIAQTPGFNRVKIFLGVGHRLALLDSVGSASNDTPRERVARLLRLESSSAPASTR